MRFNLRFVVFPVIAVFCLLWSVTPPKDFSVLAEDYEQDSFDKREAAYRANNFGVAQLEQFNYKEGAEAFGRALTLDSSLKIAQINLAIALFNLQDNESALPAAKAAAQNSPDSLQPKYILGLIAKNQNRTDDAIAAFQEILEIDREDVGANVNLGQIYVQQRKSVDAVRLFRTAIFAEPYNSTALYNLATALLRTDAREEGQQLMARFQTLRQSGAATSLGQNYLEQGRYAEAIASTGTENELVDKTDPKVTFQSANVGLPASKSSKSLKAYKKVATLIDFDGDGDLDIAQTVPAKLLRNDKGKFADVTSLSGDFANGANLFCHSIVAGDYDNDGLVDLFVSWSGKLALYKNTGKGKFSDATLKAKFPAITSAPASAFVDVDHDGDLDIVLSAAEKATSFLFRNNGDGSFLDISETAGVSIGVTSKTIIPTDYDNRRDVDLLFLPTGESPVLLRNLRNGAFKNVAADANMAIEGGNLLCAAVGDFNKDSFVDFFFGQNGKAGVFAISDGRGKFVIKDAPEGTADATSALFLDHDNDGLLDLVVNTAKGLTLSRNLGDSWAEASDRPFKTNLDLSASKQILSADLDSDGDLDLVLYAKNGMLEFLRNDGGNRNNSEIVRLQGRVSNRTGIGAKIDMRSGSLTQKLESYSASPASVPSEIHFGLGKREKPDAVRVIWSSGIVQAETEFPSARQNQTAKNNQPFKIEELDRKPSSCPYLYTWNGERFEFITDFLGGGEMGNWKETGAYHYPDSDEFVRITSDQLKAKDGKYEIRVTNELEEALFLDHLKLIAVEHDANTEVYPNEGLGIPTAGQQILYTTVNARPPVSALDTEGKSVLPQIENIDRRFYDSFKSLNIRGYAETHNLTLNLDNRKNYQGRTLLLLTGWTDYAFSSDNVAASQSGKSLVLPRLQVRNKNGEWQTVVNSVGVSVGRPQTLIVDLTGKFLSDSREVRIVTNFKTYWDRIAVDVSEQKSVKRTEPKLSQTTLRVRGFSEEIKYGEMISANYEVVLNDGRWKYFPGNFTKLGPINPLLEAVDDTFVISKTGDEIVMSFEALPELPKDKKYTFLLFADGYSKEMDINSGSPDQVFPLPFKGMSNYPYSPAEQFPMTDEKRRIYDEYNTRSVRGVLPRLEAFLIK